MKSQMVSQLRKSVQVELMPSVRVRPTLRVELKHRLMNQRLPAQATHEQNVLDLSQLN